jgi:hypothetical protein
VARDHFVALGLGVLAALFYLSVALRSPGAVMLANLAQLPLFITGLGWGLMAALTAAAAASAVVLVVLPTPMFGFFVLIVIVPVVLLVHLALQSRTTADGAVEWYPPGYLLSWLGALAAVSLLGGALYFAGAEDGLEGVARRYVGAVLAVLASDGAEGRLDVLTARIAQFMPATAMATWQFVVIVNGYLAQGLLARFGRNIRPGAPFAQLTLPRWTNVVLIVCIAAGFTGGQLGYAGRNAAIAMSVPFFFLGLSVIHAVSSRWPGRSFALLVLYLLILFQVWLAVLVAGLGLIEQWLQLRRRRAGSDEDREKE